MWGGTAGMIRSMPLLSPEQVQAMEVLDVIGNKRGEEACDILIRRCLNQYICLTLGLGTHVAKARELLTQERISRADIDGHVADRMLSGTPISTGVTGVFHSTVVAPLANQRVQGLIRPITGATGETACVDS